MGEVYYYHFYQDDSGKEYCFHLKDSYYHAVTILNEKEGKCYYISQGWLAEKVNNGYHLENFFWLEKILQMFQCMVLHSCHIQKDGEAILFTAPSGTANPRRVTCGYSITMPKSSMVTGQQSEK